MAQRWWEKWPERLESELNELDELGVRYEIDEKSKNDGKLALNLEYKLDSTPIYLRVSFPDNYPYFRFEVSTDDLDLERHQNPFVKNLCLIGRATGNWSPNEDTVARFLENQLPKVIESARGGDESMEEQQGEPISDYFPYQRSMVLIDGTWDLDIKENHGQLLIGYNQNTGSFKVAVIELQDSSGTVLAEASDAIKSLYDEKKIMGHWVRLNTPPEALDAEIQYKKLDRSHPALGKKDWKRDFIANTQFGGILGITFPEEIGYKKEGRGWIFIIVHKEKKAKKKWNFKYHYARAGRIGPDDLIERIPKLQFLKDKIIGVVGLGSIGAASAIELARCGAGELHILDYDYVDPGNIVRWPLGHFYVGAYKGESVEHFISQHYPYTRVSKLNMCIGSTLDGGFQPDELNNFICDLDLIFEYDKKIKYDDVSDFKREATVKNIASIELIKAGKYKEIAGVEYV